METTEELKAKLAEYGALPDDLTARVTWVDANPPPTVTVVCRECGVQMKTLSLSWQDVRQELELRGFLADKIGGWCDKCQPPDEEES